MLSYINLCLLIGLLAIIFHFLIMVKIIPYNITWGGRLKNDREMYVFETFSILVNGFFILILLFKAGYVESLLQTKVLDTILWVFFAIFSINTIGNIFAKTRFEKYFTIVTLLLAVLIYLILS